MASNGNDNEINFDATLRQHIKNSSATSVAVCDRFDPDTATAYLERTLSQSALSVYEEHLTTCVSCRRHIIELSRLLPQIEVATVSPEKAAPNFLGDLRQWFSGWRLGALAGLGVATAALLLFFVNTQYSSKNADIAIAENRTAEPQATIATRMGEEQNQAPQLKDTKNEAFAKTAATPMPSASLSPDIAKTTAKKDAAAPTDAPAATAAPAAPVIATAPGIVPPPPSPPKAALPEESKRESNRDELAALNQSQIRTDNWQQQRALPTPTPRGPAVNQMQADRALARAEEAKENRARAGQTQEVAVGAQGASVLDKAAESEKKKTAEKDTGLIAAKRSAVPMLQMKPGVAVPIRPVGNKNFRFENGVWIDTEYNAGSGLPVVRLKHKSDEFKQTLKNIAALKPYFDLQSVTVIWQGKVYEVRK